MSQYRSSTGRPFSGSTNGTYPDSQSKEFRELLAHRKDNDVGIYLLRKADAGDFKVLEVALRALCADLVPPQIPYNLETATQRHTREKNWQSASAAMFDVAKTCASFIGYEKFGPQLSYSLERTEMLMTEYFKRIMDSWSGILSWLVTFAVRAPTATYPSRVYSAALACLHDILGGIPANNDWRTELLEKPETMDCFFIYLRYYEKLQRSGEYRFDSRTHECLRKILEFYVHSPPHDLYTSFITRILSVSKATRETILSSLVSHGVGGVEDRFAKNLEDFNSMGNLLSTYAMLAILVIKDPRAFAMFYRKRFFSQLVEAYFITVKQAAIFCGLHPTKDALRHSRLLQISASLLNLLRAMIHSPHSPKLILLAIKHNAIPCVLLCMANSDMVATDDSTLKSFSRCFEFLRTYLSNSDMYIAGPNELQQILSNSCALGRIQSNPLWGPIWNITLKTLEQRKNCEFNTQSSICSNLMHNSKERSPPSGSALSQCGKCLSVAYCSSECQREDWTSIHREECEKLCQDKTSPRLITSVTEEMRHNQLGYLEHCMSGDSFETLRPPELGVDQPILVAHDFTRQGTHAHYYRYSRPLSEVWCVRNVSTAWKERIARCVADVTSNPGEAVMAMAFFPHSADWSIYLAGVLTLRADTGRFQVSKSVFVPIPTQNA
ncbi:hypothetical protein D9611_014323 [Ephemerocybe angulata]|uniref:MYND-type domain-containing protein n=1 Tax=Ephemerocybe angulata TaxID=980116 RepID=A0A8H5C3C5_9AGAR|nr:hypothetical protein D9611_014323 [Tulosesus angulatus]